MKAILRWYLRWDRRMTVKIARRDWLHRIGWRIVASETGLLSYTLWEHVHTGTLRLTAGNRNTLESSHKRVSSIKWANSHWKALIIAKNIERKTP